MRGKEILGVVKRSTILNNIKFEEEDNWTAMEKMEAPIVSSK
jgi:hypothetical protein